MDTLTNLSEAFRSLVPFLAVLAVLLLGVLLVYWLLFRFRRDPPTDSSIFRQLVLLTCVALAVLTAVLALPVSDTVRNQLLSVLGLVLSAIITLASTTLMANAMAGVMLRVVRNFRVGDFIRVGDAFGRVTVRGLVHTEIQTQDRDLMTLPNLHLVTHPVVVIRSRGRHRGTIVATTLSLGYDVPRTRVEPLLRRAAETTGLREPFVYILELGDFSVTYRIAGLLEEVKQLLTVRSRLRCEVLDALHGAGIEIVSPTFMNQRRFPLEPPVIPPLAEGGLPALSRLPEELVFEKAERAEGLQELEVEAKDLEKEIEELAAGLGVADEISRRVRERTLTRRRRRLEAVRAALEAARAEGS